MRNIVVCVFLISVTLSITESKYVGGYYWSGAYKMALPEDLNPKLLTHIYYAFLEVKEDGSFLIQLENKGFVQGLVKLKKVNPDLKLLFSCISVGDSFSKVVADEKLRKSFVKNALDLVKKHNYDGFDFDWEFPKEADKENFAKLLQEIHAEFKKHDYLITAAVRAIPIYKGSGYNVPEMSKYLDIINIMTYDYYGSWSNTTGQNAPLYPSSLDSDYEKTYLNVDASIKNWVNAGAQKKNLAMGLPFYGRTFTLKDPKDHGLHAPSSGGGSPPSPSYRTILRDYQNFTTVWNSEQKGSYKYSGSTWLSYDDERSINIKAQYAVTNKLAGVFIWQLGGDDVTGEFSKNKYALLQTINDVFK